MRMSKKIHTNEKGDICWHSFPDTHFNQNVQLIGANQVQYKITEAPITYYFLFIQLAFIYLTISLPTPSQQIKHPRIPVQNTQSLDLWYS